MEAAALSMMMEGRMPDYESLSEEERDRHSVEFASSVAHLYAYECARENKKTGVNKNGVFRFTEAQLQKYYNQISLLSNGPVHNIIKERGLNGTVSMEDIMRVMNAPQLPYEKIISFLKQFEHAIDITKTDEVLAYEQEFYKNHHKPQMLPNAKNDIDPEALLITQLPPTLHPDVAYPPDAPDGVSECMITSNMKRTITQTKGFPARIRRRLAGDKVYEIRPCTGDSARGLGMFAGRDLEIGDFVLAERPLLVFAQVNTMDNQALPLRGLSEQEKVKAHQEYFGGYVQTAVERLPEELRKKFMALGDCKKAPGEEPSVIGRMQTNAYGLNGLRDDKSDPNARGYGGVFNELSRVNHSCSPNLDRHWDTTSFSMRLFACRPVKKGEELTATYIGLFDSAHRRQKPLKDMYGIASCGCPSCSSNSPTTSDNRRAHIQRCGVQRLFDAWVKNTEARDGKKIVGQLESALKEIEDEGLQVDDVYVKVLRMLLDVYVALGDGEKVVEVGRRIAKSTEAKTGGDALLKFLTNVDNLKKDKKWGIKTKGKGKAKAA